MARQQSLTQVILFKGQGMFKRVLPWQVGLTLTIFGVIGILVSLFADSLGLGQDTSMYGRFQFIGTALGFILVVMGTAVYLMGRDPA